MPAKYSHIRKRTASATPLKKSSSTTNTIVKSTKHTSPNPHIDRSITQALSAVAHLERAIARIILLRYEQDIARLFSTHLYYVALSQLPTFMMRCASLGGPGWVAYNAESDDVKDFFRAVISMDLRQSGERVATKSILWSYTMLRQMALSNNINVCPKRGLHSLDLLPYFPSLQEHLDALEALPPPSFSKPPFLGQLVEGLDALEDACKAKYGELKEGSNLPASWDCDWWEKMRLGYERLTQTLWRVGREFDVRGYGLVLRNKLTKSWCDCGCSTDHLGEVCEQTVSEDEEINGVRRGKRKEWDGRGSGVHRWETEEEEDIWDADLLIGFNPEDSLDIGIDADMTVGELIEWRYLKAEREKEEGNNAFRKGFYGLAAKHYQRAHEIEPELPYYQLNLAAAHLKLSNWIEAEQACTKALMQHRSEKAFYRRAKALKMLGRTDEAIRDLRAVLKIQPNNHDAAADLLSLYPPEETPSKYQILTSSSSTTHTNRSHIPKPKPPKPFPFPRAPADDTKLKIVLIPTTVAMPIRAVDNEDPDYFCDQPISHSLSHAPQSRTFKGKGKDPKQYKEIITRPETFRYPSWDRYVVHKVGS